MKGLPADASRPSLSEAERWIAQIPLFAELSTRQQEALLDSADFYAARAGDVILTEGQELEGLLYFLISGEFQVSKLAPNGKETILRLISTSEAFGLAALFDETRAPATLTSTQASRIMRIPSGPFLDILRQDFDLTLRILKLLSQRLREAYQQLHLVASTKSRARLARLITAQIERSGLEPHPDGWLLKTPLTYSTLSRMAAVSYEETIRILQEWTALLEYRRGKIILRDIEGLRAIAEQD